MFFSRRFYYTLLYLKSHSNLKKHNLTNYIYAYKYCGAGYIFGRLRAFEIVIILNRFQLRNTDAYSMLYKFRAGVPAHLRAAAGQLIRPEGGQQGRGGERGHRQQHYQKTTAQQHTHKTNKFPCNKQQHYRIHKRPQHSQHTSALLYS